LKQTKQNKTNKQHKHKHNQKINKQTITETNAARLYYISEDVRETCLTINDEQMKQKMNPTLLSQTNSDNSSSDTAKLMLLMNLLQQQSNAGLD